MIRDGLEDFDYLTLADAWLGKKTTQGFVAKMARSLKDYEQDPLVLEKTAASWATCWKRRPRPRPKRRSRPF